MHELHIISYALSLGTQPLTNFEICLLLSELSNVSFGNPNLEIESCECKHFLFFVLANFIYFHPLICLHVHLYRMQRDQGRENEQNPCQMKISLLQSLTMNLKMLTRCHFQIQIPTSFCCFDIWRSYKIPKQRSKCWHQFPVILQRIYG